MKVAFLSGRERRYRARNGLSLLEVILAIAILGGALAVIGQLVSLGYQHALQARLRSDGNVLCDTKMAEIAAAVLPLDAVNQQSIDEAPDWAYSVDVENSEQPGLLVVTVTVNPRDQTTRIPIIITATRFMPDPDYEPEEEEDE